MVSSIARALRLRRKVDSECSQQKATKKRALSPDCFLLVNPDEEGNFKENFGDLPCDSRISSKREFGTFDVANSVGVDLWLRGRIISIEKSSFLLGNSLRIVRCDISSDMRNFLGSLHMGDVVDAWGTVEFLEKEIVGATEQGAFLKVNKLFAISRSENVKQVANLTNAVTRLEAGIAQLFRTFLVGAQFIETSATTDLSLMLTGDFERVFSVDAGRLNVKMGCNDHYHEVLELLGAVAVEVFANIQSTHDLELRTIQKIEPFTEPTVDELVILTFGECLELLKGTSLKTKNLQGFTASVAKQLAEVVKKKFATDFFIVDKFPASRKNTDIMPDPYNEHCCNRYQAYFGGIEVLSGHQTIHDRVMLQKVNKLATGGVEGSVPHAGCVLNLRTLTKAFVGLVGLL